MTTTAKDLSQEPPRSPRTRIAGYALLARMADKGRAELRGASGEYHFNCPVDNLLFRFKGVHGSEVKEVLKTGASDVELAAWLDQHGTPKSEAEKQAWSDETEKLNFHDEPKWKTWFDEESVRLGLNPVKTTLFTLLEAEDCEFGGTPCIPLDGGRS